jgi:hypothetical protein
MKKSSREGAFLFVLSVDIFALKGGKVLFAIKKEGNLAWENND